MITAPAMACTDWQAVAMFDQAEVSAALAVWVKSGPDANHWTTLNVARELNGRDHDAALADKCGGQQ
jgi:hypothetical protein